MPTEIDQDNVSILPSPEPEEHLVICVDDDQNFLKSLEFFLPEKINQEGDAQSSQGLSVWYRFLFFDNPLHALDTLKELTEDREIVAMVISDQKMPDMKGTELLAEAKKISHQSIRVLLTGYAGVESAITAINENLLDKYLTKPIEDENDFIVSIRHLLQRFRMQGTIIAQARVIHELYQFSNVLNGIEDFQKTLDSIVSFTEEMLRCQRISIMLDDGGLLRIKASKGIPKEVVDSTSIPIGNRISGEVFQSRKAILVKDLDEVPYLDSQVDVSAQSFISVPILLAGLSSGDHPLGVINITQKEDNLPFTENDLEILTYIANTASIAIHNQINRIQLQMAYVETRTQAAALEYQAMHDALTGLPNRNMLKERMQEAILVGHREKIPFSLLIMDLNHFKEINDTLGHHSGDLLLQQVGRKLQEVVQGMPGADGAPVAPDQDMLVRLGGDEFAVLLPGAGMERSVQVAARIVDAFSHPFNLEGLSLEISMGIGLTLYPDHGEEVNLLIQRADVAMYVAKHSGIGYSIYDSKTDQYNHRRLAMVSGLRQAIEDNQLVLHYQPKVDLVLGRISGVEALVRWQHPQYGFMPPDQFIQLAEQTDLIKPLTLWVLNEALHQCSQLCQDGFEISMAVNLSARNLQDEGFPDQVRELLEKWGVKPELLELEITESTVMANPELAMVILKRLSDMGIQLAIDDFGTGHSSLAYIKLLPVHEIKIDKSFVMSMGVNTNDVMIVNTAIDLGHNLGLSVVAEGIESKEIYDRLTNLGCNVGQGYFMSRPLPASQLMSWIIDSPWGVKRPS
ncbi:MAG: EAL domain-containing protein [bacterium]